MNYQISLFKNTGFNSINIPGSQALIDSCPQITLSSDDAQCDILQARGLTSLPLRVSYDDAKMVDYIRLSNGSEKVYYAASIMPTMSSPDVSVFSLTYDPINSNMASVSQIKFLDGIFERHHVATDNLFEYVEDDPLLIPSEPLELVTEMLDIDKPSDNGHGAYTHDCKVIIEATVPIEEMATATTGVAYTATSGGECVVPEVPKFGTTPAESETLVIMKDPATRHQILDIPPSSKYYDGTNATVKEGVARVRGLSTESGIIGQVAIPSDFIESGTFNPQTDGRINGYSGVANVIAPLDTKFNWEYASGVHNKRVFAGKLNTYGIASIASGNKAEFLPEDIYEGSLSSIPLVLYTADVRRNGKPYFRYKKYKGATDNFWMNCIAGLPWQNIPLVYTDKSGSEIDTMNYQTYKSIADQRANIAVDREILNDINGLKLGNLAGEAMGIMAGLAPNFGASYPNINRQAWLSGVESQGRGFYQSREYHQMMTPSMQASTTEVAGLSNMANILLQRQNDAAQERQAFEISQKIVAPEMYFPRSESIRDYIGNGACVYRYKLNTLVDIPKFDKILTMMGYADHRPAPGNESFLTNRPRFNYCKIAGASIGGTTLPRWEREAIAAVFSIGVRIWHVLPNEAYYTDGSNDLT